ncbi:MAG: phosphotriesterase [Bacteroidia bacterium]|nr:phosphotriesterase [Bacteroidia bacterium]
MRFLFLYFLLPLQLLAQTPYLMTTRGPIPADSLGLTLIHEHIFLDWSGADSMNPDTWDEETAFRTMLPYLRDMQSHGVRTMMDCTPGFLGRNPLQLQRVADSTGLQILTNTGYYGAVQNKYLPPDAYTDTHRQLARRWLQEWRHGIGETGIRPGFIKIGVEVPLPPLHEKLVRAAALTHLRSGLTIVAHTGPDAGAYREVELLREMGVAPEALVWTHAQEGTREAQADLARQGVWVSLDGLGWVDPADYQGDSTYLKRYVGMLQHLRAQQLLHRVLISHDAGWYTHGQAVQTIKPYTAIFRVLIPALQQAGFTEADFHQLLVVNPVQAYAVRVRKMPIR